MHLTSFKFPTKVDFLKTGVHIPYNCSMCFKHIMCTNVYFCAIIWYEYFSLKAQNLSFSFFHSCALVIVKKF